MLRLDGRKAMQGTRAHACTSKPGFSLLNPPKLTMGDAVNSEPTERRSELRAQLECFLGFGQPHAQPAELIMVN